MTTATDQAYCYCSDESHSVVTIKGVRFLRCVSCHSLTDVSEPVAKMANPSLIERALNSLRDPIKDEPVYGREMTPEKSWRTLCAVAIALVIVAVIIAACLAPVAVK